MEQLLEGVSGVDYISRFDASDFPTKFAAQIKGFDVGDLVDKKNARRYDDCLSYTMVASKKVRRGTVSLLPKRLLPSCRAVTGRGVPCLLAVECTALPTRPEAL